MVKGSVLAAEAVETHGKRQCLSHGGSGNARQRRRLTAIVAPSNPPPQPVARAKSFPVEVREERHFLISHEGSGNTWATATCRTCPERDWDQDCGAEPEVPDGLPDPPDRPVTAAGQHLDIMTTRRRDKLPQFFDDALLRAVSDGNTQSGEGQRQNCAVPPARGSAVP